MTGVLTGRKVAATHPMGLDGQLISLHSVERNKITEKLPLNSLSEIAGPINQQLEKDEQDSLTTQSQKNQNTVRNLQGPDSQLISLHSEKIGNTPVKITLSLQTMVMQDKMTTQSPEYQDKSTTQDRSTTQWMNNQDKQKSLRLDNGTGQLSLS